MNRIPNFLKWLVGSLLAIAILTGVMLLQNPKNSVAKYRLPGPLTEISSTPDAKQVHNLLVEITDSKQQFVVGALLMNNRNKLSIAAIDPNVAVDLREFGFRDLRSASNQVSAGQLVDALNVSAGLSIDGILNLSEIGLGALLDTIGGVTVNLPTKLKFPTAESDKALILPAGKTHLDGATAAAYAIYRQPGESATEQSVRFHPVLSKVLDALPADPQKLNSQLMSLGQAGSSNLSHLDVAHFLANSRGGWSSAGDLSLATSPSQLATDFTDKWLWLNTGSILSAFIDDQSDALWSSDGTQYRISVCSQSSEDRLMARELLSRGSIYFVDGGGASPSLHSHLIITDSVPAEVVQQLADKLSLPELDTVLVSQISTGTDMQLDLGKDFTSIQQKGSSQ